MELLTPVENPGDLHRNGHLFLRGPSDEENENFSIEKKNVVNLDLETYKEVNLIVYNKTMILLVNLIISITLIKCQPSRSDVF